MPVLLRCPQGHQWESAAGQLSWPPDSPPTCPVCAAGAVTVGEGSPGAAPDETLGASSASRAAVAAGTGAAAADETLLVSDMVPRTARGMAGPAPSRPPSAPAEAVATGDETVQTSTAAPAGGPEPQGLPSAAAAPAPAKIAPAQDETAVLSHLATAGGGGPPEAPSPPASQAATIRSAFEPTVLPSRKPSPARPSHPVPQPSPPPLHHPPASPLPPSGARPPRDVPAGVTAPAPSAAPAPAPDAEARAETERLPDEPPGGESGALGATVIAGAATQQPAAAPITAGPGSRGNESASQFDETVLPTEMTPRAKPVAPASAPRIPGHEILSELGRGGMGVVYLARQVAVNRLVALKMIRSGSDADAEEVARFRIEAEAIARLQDPHIVQIYEVGECDGRPYCSLEFVNGGSLQQKLSGTALPGRQAAQLLEPLARAVYAAHRRGIIHRDLKPANVLLTRDGVPKITDFGLAKKLDQEAGAGQTQTGAIMGTPSYMAPEQAWGKSRQIGPAADIYSLGAVLYDMLTGRPPFKGETVLDTLQQVQGAEPVPPARLQPRLPRDLEIICLTCLHKEPHRRYASALELADDLRRYLAGEPIRARPVSVLERAGKWARRKPAAAAVVGLSAVLLLGLLAGSFTIAALQHRRAEQETAYAALERQRADQETQLRAEAQQQQRRAEKNFQKAREAVDHMLTGVGKGRLAQEPRMEKLRRDLLTRAQTFYEGFLQEKGDDPGVRWETGRAYQRVGDIQEMLGQYAAAERAYRAALGFFALLAEQAPDQPAYRQDLGTAYNGLAIVLQAAGQRDQAAAAFRQALGTKEALATAFPQDQAYTRDLAASWQNWANLLLTQNRAAEAEAAYREAITRLGRLADQFADQPVYRHELARAHSSLGVLLLNTRPQDAEPAFRQARALQEPLVDRYPDVQEYRHELARSHFLEGNWLQIRRRLPEAEGAYGQAVELFARLVKEFPGVPDYRHGLAACYLNFGELRRLSQRPQEGEQLLGQAVSLFGELAREFPLVPVYRQELARAYHNLGVLRNDLGRGADAEQAHRQAVAERRQLVEEFPTEPAYRQELAYSHGELAIVLAKAGRHAQSEASFRQAVALLEKLETEHPAESAYWRDQILQHNNLASLLAALGQWRQAEQSYRRVVGLEEKQVAAFPAGAGPKSDLGQSLHKLAGVLLQRGQQAEARQCLFRAIRQQQAALATDPQPSYRQALGLHYLGLIEVTLAEGDHAEAARAVAGQIQAAAERPDYPRAAAFLARCVTLAGKDEALPQAKRRELAQTYGDRALEFLRQAVARGYKDATYLRYSPDLEPLRSRDDFKKLVSDVEVRTKAARR